MFDGLLALDLTRVPYSYWGQNSYGATHSGDTANYQKNLSYYCQVSQCQPPPSLYHLTRSAIG